MVWPFIGVIILGGVSRNCSPEWHAYGAVRDVLV